MPGILSCWTLPWRLGPHSQSDGPEDSLHSAFAAHHIRGPHRRLLTAATKSSPKAALPATSAWHRRLSTVTIEPHSAPSNSIQVQSPNRYERGLRKIALAHKHIHTYACTHAHTQSQPFRPRSRIG
eukprot:548357-Amphidinium_carterae.2